MNAGVCILVIGDLGETGKLSLETLQNINPARVCITSNSTGKDWLLNAAPESIKKLFCFHPKVFENFEFKYLEDKKEYSEYRSKDFRILTLLKWDLMKESLQSHPESEALLFSDLDIYWLEDPNDYVSRLKSSKSVMFVQNDASRLRPNWCCTGVMFWKNTDQSVKFLSELRNRQKFRIESGMLQDDEDTFNQYISEPTSLLLFERLPIERFLVGRHFTKLFFGSSKNRRQFCFHANYLTGLNRKFESLQSIDKYIRKGVFPWKELIKYLTIPRLKRIRDGVRRRMKLR
jgi:hypothetical protein